MLPSLVSERVNKTLTHSLPSFEAVVSETTDLLATVNSSLSSQSLLASNPSHTDTNGSLNNETNCGARFTTTNTISSSPFDLQPVSVNICCSNSRNIDRISTSSLDVSPSKVSSLVSHDHLILMIQVKL